MSVEIDGEGNAREATVRTGDAQGGAVGGSADREDGGRGDAIRIAMPAVVPVTALVYHRSEAACGLDRADILAIVVSWLEAHAGEPILSGVREWIGSRRMGLGATASRDFPVPPAFAYCPKCRKHERYPDLRSLDSCVVLGTEDSLAPPRVGLWAVVAASQAVAERLGGVIWSPELKVPRPRDREWRVLPPDGSIRAASHLWFTSSFDERMRGWVTSCGMARFGLPELEAIEVPPGLASPVSRLLGAVAQVLVRKVAAAAARSPRRPFQLDLEAEIAVTTADLAEAEGGRGGAGEAGDGRRERPKAPASAPVGTMSGAGAGAISRADASSSRDAGAAGSVAVRVRIARPVDSSGESRFLRLCAPRDFDEAHGVFLQEAIRTVVPGDPDRIAHCSADDAEMEAAHRRAVARLEEVKRRFREGLGIGVALLVKHGLPGNGGSVEFVWTAVTTWRGRRLQGLLQSTPVCGSRLRAGQPVELHETEVYDWAIEKPDGSHEGGYTTDVLLGR